MNPPPVFSLCATKMPPGNSSGKSTFLQSILLVAQTLANKIGSRSVVLNGALAKLGQFDDLKSADGEANQIVIGWTCQPVVDPDGMWAPSVRRAPFATDEVVPEPITRTLEAAVVDWLHYLGVAESIQSHDKGKFGHELVVSVAGGKRHHDLTHVGVGVSQVLPILVASLLADPDTTLVFEQRIPENVLEEDPKLLMWYDQALTRTGEDS